MAVKEARKFWNDKKQILDFADEKPSRYLVNFFSSQKNREFKKVLDIGCGGGRNTEMLVRFGFDTSACDLHKSMVDFTKKRIAAFDKKAAQKIIFASMLSLSYDDNFFDYVVSNGVFHNANCLDELKSAIKEASRVLKNRGVLILNIFSSKVIDSSLVPLSKEKFTYVTPQGLPLVLISRYYLTKILDENNLHSICPITENKKNVSTGKRCVLRGVFIKIN